MFNEHASSYLLTMAKKLGCITEGEYTLSAGSHVGWYFDARKLTLYSATAQVLATELLDIAIDHDVVAVGGPIVGAVPMVACVIAASAYRDTGDPIVGFMVRPSPKEWGKQQAIDGNIRAGWRVMLVDDVVTTGYSLMHAIRAAESAGCKVVKTAALLDRSVPGVGVVDILKEEYGLVSALSTTDIWPES